MRNSSKTGNVVCVAPESDAGNPLEFETRGGKTGYQHARMAV